MAEQEMAVIGMVNGPDLELSGPRGSTGWTINEDDSLHVSQRYIDPLGEKWMPVLSVAAGEWRYISRSKKQGE